MKKILSIIAMSLMVMLTTNAQKSTALDKKVRFGFKIDAGSSWLGPKESYVSKDGSKFYFGYGFISDFTLTDNYIISTGLNIVSAGGKLTMQNGAGYGGDGVIRGTPNTYSISLQYVEIPVALKLKTDAVKGVRYWGQFGTYLGINIGSRLTGTALYKDVDGQTVSRIYNKEQITSATVPVNMGLDLGAGIEYPFNSKSYGSIGLGYHSGFIDITKQGAWGDGKVNLNGFFLRTAFFF